ncbi:MULTISPECIES: hypothetical protein [unclassified Microbacterium]|uniref:hypothetical protein n=1 Tax=unclassified Microbacterium TaxID=2609290 RepID=UPI0030179CB3
MAERQKTESGSADEAKETAQKELFDLVTDAAKSLRTNGVALYNQVSAIRGLANAYRLLDGGPQPGEVGSGK